MASGKTLELYRTKASMSREALGKELGVSAVTIWRWENDERAPRRTRWMKLRDLIGIPIEDLMAFETKRQREAA